MARGRKPALSLDEQLANVITKIDNMESSIKELKKTKKDLENQIKQKKLIELDDIISEKGLTLDEVKKILSSEE